MAASDDPRPRIPLALPLGSRFGSINTDARVINGFVERDEHGEWELYKRAGMTQQGSFSHPNAGTKPVGQFASVAVDLAIVTPGPRVPQLFSYFYDPVANTVRVFQNSTIQGTLAVHAIEKVQLVTTTQYQSDRLLVNPGARDNVGSPFVEDIQFSNTAPAVLTKQVIGISATGRPLVPGVVTLDDTNYVMDIDAVIYNSGIGNADFTTSPPAATVQPRSEPGLGVFLAKQGPYVVALKTWSTELLFDNANPAPSSPLSPAQGMQMKIGCVDGRTVQDIDDNLLWVAQSHTGMPFVAMMTNYKIQPISPAWIDRMLEVGANFGIDIYSGVFRYNGHIYYFLTFDAVPYNPLIPWTDQTIVYDITQQQWYFWTRADARRWQFCFPATLPSGTTVGMVLFLNLDDVTKGYHVDNTNGTDDSSLFLMDAYTPNADFKSRKKKTLSRMDVIGDQQPAFLNIRFSEDDQKTWSQFRSVDLNQKRPSLVNCGTFLRRSWNLRYFAPYKMRISAIELDLGVGH